MKKLIFVFVVLFLISCADEPGGLELSQNDPDTTQIFYTLNGIKYPVDFKIEAGETILVENENAAKFRETFESETLVTYIDSDKNAPIFFSNVKEYELFNADEARKAARLKEIGIVQAKGNAALASREVPSFTIARASGLRYAATIPVSTYYSNRHVGFNQCITGGINFQDEISSLDVDYGLRARFFVNDNYNGKQLVIDARYNPDGIAIGDLHDIKRSTYTYFDDSDDWASNLCGAFCTSWNDCITSIFVERTDVTGVRNFSNVCGSGSGGGGGGGGTPIEQEPIK